ncbi:MAG: phosphoribosylamine--glycine ligase [Syntrophobacterales bacterium]|jgi:phosphoribosylamine--glycine ligase|nr:phosphoribosylamine--glycine ligase [Syntrophobacterales bacterium]
MKVLIIGSGGREHALAWKLSQSDLVKSILCAPGNGGISDIADCVEIDVNNTDGLVRLAKREKIDLAVVGPENPLAQGIVDQFNGTGIAVFGPSMKGAEIEASKLFAKEMMVGNGIPTAPFRSFIDYDDAVRYIRDIAAPFVIKADGLCAGKGAYVIKDNEEAEKVLEDLMVRRIYGNAGVKIIIEDFLSGVEASCLAFTDGKTILPMLPSQDHKPLLDNGEGPNTGGMGAYTPIPFVDGQMDDLIHSQIMMPMIMALRNRGIVYKGVLYGGLMIRDGNPFVIEFNARLGDPETQPILFKMESDIVPILMACVEGHLDSIPEIKWKPGVSVCVVLASKGYPDKPEKGKAIRGLEELKKRDNVMVFHGGTKKTGDTYYTSGGRVLGVTATGNTYEEAIRIVYDAVSCIEFEGMQYRKDIAGKALKIMKERDTKHE